MDDCRTMLQNLSMQWAAVNPHLLAFERLSDEVKRLSEKGEPQSSPAVEHDMAVATPYLIAEDLPLDGQLTFWDAPLDISTWDDMLDCDIDMHAVFGDDFEQDYL